MLVADCIAEGSQIARLVWPSIAGEHRVGPGRVPLGQASVDAEALGAEMLGTQPQWPVTTLCGVASPSLLWLVLLTIVMVVLLAWTQRSRGAATERRIRLTPQHELHIVEIEGRRLVVATGPGSAPSLICQLQEVPDRSHAEAPESRGWKIPRLERDTQDSAQGAMSAARVQAQTLPLRGMT